MREADAKTKWCPFVQFVPGNSRFYPMSTRAGLIDEKASDAAVIVETKCIGSACMAWRARTKITGGVVTKNDGFCGLAGAQS